jgi:hypothetical protein
MNEENNGMINFLLEDGAKLSIELKNFVIDGWAGRDSAAIQEHIEELKALGVKPPSATPLFYRAGANLVTTATTVQMLGEHTSGEVEVLLIGTASGTYVGVGSDHTDREAEAWSVAHSKQVCPKPVGQSLWRLEDVLPHWDKLQLESHALINGERVAYQKGSVQSLLPPVELLTRYGSSTATLPAGTAMLCGTLPVIGGLRPADRFEMSLIDPVRERRIDHAYDIELLPVVA